MRSQPSSHVIASKFTPTAVACPSCRHLMFFKSVEPWTLMYEHQLDRVTFECGDCGSLVAHTIDEDQL